MALTRVQATPRTSGLNATTVAIVFATPPSVGNAVIVPALIYNSVGTFGPTCADNKGNTYATAVIQTFGNRTVVIFFCAGIVTSGASFTVTITQPAASYFEANAIEVGGVGTGLVVDQTTKQTVTSVTPATLLTAPLTYAEVFVVAATSSNVNQASITVQAVTPPWTQEFENLSFTTSIAGEANSRVLTGVLGTTQQCAWTLATNATGDPVIAVFGGPGPPVTPSTPTSAGNLGARTDENGALKVVAVTAGSGTSPLTPFANLRMTTDDTGAVRMAAITLNPPLGPLTDLANLRVCTDETGALLVATQTAGSALTPFTNLGNLRARTDARGSLIVASGAAGSLSSAPTPLLNLRGRSDENAALIVTGLTAPSPLLTGLLSYWKLDEVSGTRADMTGLNPLTDNNTVTSAAGKIGNAAQFVAANAEYLSHPDTTPLLGTDPFTYTLWHKRASVANTLYILIGKDDPSNRAYYVGYRNTPDDAIEFGMFSTGTVIIPVTLDTNWHFLVAMYDPAAPVDQKLSLQLDNGTVVTSGTAVWAPSATPSEVRIGARQYPGFENYFNGLIDEIGLWKRVLTPAERTALYNASAGLTYPFA